MYHWPGFVDAMAAVLLLIMFMLSVFMFSHFFLTQEVVGKDTSLTRLKVHIAKLGEMLSLERNLTQKQGEEIHELKSSLTKVLEEKTSLQKDLITKQTAIEKLKGLEAINKEAITQQEDAHKKAQLQISVLNNNLAELDKQIDALQNLIGDYEVKDRESQAKIEDLGTRLNVVLATEVHKLQKYSSEFFGRLREILGDKEDVRVVGDRFVFQAEVLFPLGRDTFNPESKVDLDRIAAAIKQLEEEIPSDIDWALRIDGHTDTHPIIGYGRFKSNWDLSVARAVAVLHYFIDKGVDPKRLVAAGFGEFLPLDEGKSEESLARNRRIELRITNR